MAAIELGLIDSDFFADEHVDAIELAINKADPAGAVKMYIGATAPTGWLLLNGATVVGAQTLYPDLWAIAPAGWKSGSNLILPNMASRFPIGQSGSLGETGGSNTHTIGTANLPPHAHAAGTLATSAHSVSDPGHGHSVNDPGHFHVQNVMAAGTGSITTRADYNVDTTTGGIFPQSNTPTANAPTGISINGNTTGISVAAHTISGSTGNGPGTSTAIDHTPANVTFNFIIRAY